MCEEKHRNMANCTDNEFGPVVRACRGDFDFTLLFEETILSATPSILVMVLAGARILYLRRRPKIVWARKFQLLKLVSCLYISGSSSLRVADRLPDDLDAVPDNAGRSDDIVGYTAQTTFLVRAYGGLLVVCQRHSPLFSVIFRTCSKHAPINYNDHLSAIFNLVGYRSLPNSLACCTKLFINKALHNVRRPQDNRFGS